MTTASQLLLTFLVNACWQIALIALAALLCARLLRRTTARYKHMIWVAALTLCIGLPLLTASRLLSPRLAHRPQTEQRALQQTTVSSLPLTQSSAPDSPVQTEDNWLIRINANSAGLLAAAYLLFLLYRSASLLKAWMKAMSTARGAYPFDLAGDIQAIIDACQTAIGVTNARVLFSAAVPVPITVGSFRPFVILPETMLGENRPDLLKSAIGHELVHVFRRDYFLNLIYELLYLPLSFHPAAALVRRRINQTRELRCDELVTERLLAPEVYARSLVLLAGSALPAGRHMTTVTVGINDADILEERIMTMLRKPRTGIQRRKLLLAAACFFFVVPCAAAVPFALRVSIGEKGPAAASQAAMETAPGAIATTHDVTPPGWQRFLHAQLRNAKSYLRGDNPRNSLAAVSQGAEQEAKKRDEKARLEQELGEKREKVDRVRLEHELKMQHERGERAEHEYKAVFGRELEERRKFEMEMKARHQAELVKEAKITMAQAIQFATYHQPGTVLECRLGRERDEVVYHVVIISGEGKESATTHLQISAIDGRVMNSEKEER